MAFYGTQLMLVVDSYTAACVNFEVNEIVNSKHCDFSKPCDRIQKSRGRYFDGEWDPPMTHIVTLIHTPKYSILSLT